MVRGNPLRIMFSKKRKHDIGALKNDATSVATTGHVVHCDKD
jgi:hypothetical protein